MTERRRLDVIEYADWKQGSQFGKGLLPGHGQPSDYQACNMQVYTNGSLGPRPYFIKADRQLVAAGALDPLPAVNGHGLYIDPNSGTNMVGIVLADGTAYGLAIGGSFASVGTPTLALATPVPPPTGNFYFLTERFQFTPVSSTMVFVSPGFTWNPSSPHTALAAVTWPGGAQPTGVVIWKERSFGFGASAAPNRIYYSDASAVTTFSSASQFFDVGTSGVAGLFPLRDALLIAENNGTWHALTGNSPQTWSRREIGKMRAANSANRPTIYRNAVWQLSQRGRGLAVITPEGANETQLDWVLPTIDQQILNAQITPLVAVGSHEMSALFFPFIGDNISNGTNNVIPPYLGFQAIEMVNGAFTWSKFWGSPTSTGYGQSDDNAVGARILGAWEWNNEIVIAVDESRLPNNSTDRVRLYQRAITLDRPSKGVYYEELAGVYNDAGSSQTNMTSGEVWLRMYAPPPGNRVRVSKILVDVTYWDGADYADPAVTAQILSESGSLYSTAHTSADHTLTNTSTGDTGVPGRIEWYPGPLPASEYMQVRFTGIVGVALRKVIVEYEVLPE